MKIEFATNVHLVVLELVLEVDLICRYDFKLYFPILVWIYWTLNEILHMIYGFAFGTLHTYSLFENNTKSTHKHHILLYYDCLSEIYMCFVFTNVRYDNPLPLIDFLNMTQPGTLPSLSHSPFLMT